MSPNRRIAGKTALVTGAASGIGKATARALAEEGAKVLVADIDSEAAREVAEAMSGQARTIAWQPLDVTSEESWQVATGRIVEDWKQLDVLVNNAGISLVKKVTDMGLEDWRAVTAVNLDGVFLGTKHGVLAMRKSGGGSIVNVSSASGLKASPSASAYCATKAAILHFSKAVALECAESGDEIRVNSVLPGGVATPMWEKMEWWRNFLTEGRDEQAARDEFSRWLKQLIPPEEIAEAILYLASDASRFVNGANFVIDGGYTA